MRIGTCTRRALPLIATAGAALLPAPEVLADSFTATWLEPVSGEWTDPTKWSTNPVYPNNVPNTFYTPIIDRVGAPYTITVDRSITINALFVDSPDARLVISAGTFATGSLATISFSRGQLDVTGGTASTRHARLLNGSLTRLQAGAFTANLTELIGSSFIQTGGVHTPRDGLYLRDGSAYHLSAGTINGGPYLHVGLGGSSSFTITGGTLYQGGYQTITGGLGTGSFVIDGASSRLAGAPVGDDTNLVGIGTNSVGNLNVRNGATAELGFTEVGLNYGAGSLVVESGATATAQRLRAGFGSWEFPPNPGHEVRGTGSVVVDGARLDVLGWPQQQTGQPTVEIGTSAFAGALGAGHLRVAGGSLHVTGPLRVNVTGQVLFEGSAVTSDALEVAGGSATFASGSLETGTLHVSAGGDLRLTNGRDKTLACTSLSITSARVDLGDNRMIVDYDAGPSPLPQVRGLIASAYAGGSWTGDGLTSAAAAGGTRHGVGYAEASALFTSFPATFGGYEVDDTAVLVAYARYGDANLDGAVNLQDFNRLASHFGTTGADWTMGDFNYDQLVNISDFNLVAANFGLATSRPSPTAADWAALVASIPEPSVAFALALPVVLARRRRP